MNSPHSGAKNSRYKMKHKTQVISSLSDIPAGFVPATSFLLDRQKILSKAAMSGALPAVKLMRTPSDVRGPVFYNDQQATAYLDEHYGIPTGSSHGTGSRTAELPKAGSGYGAPATELPIRSADSVLAEFWPILDGINPAKMSLDALDRTGYCTGSLVDGLSRARELAVLCGSTEMVAVLDEGIKAAKLKMVDLGTELTRRHYPAMTPAELAHIKADAVRVILSCDTPQELQRRVDAMRN